MLTGDAPARPVSRRPELKPDVENLGIEGATSRVQRLRLRCSVAERCVLIRLFYPILAGATLKDRVVAAFGALICLGLSALLCAQFSFAPRDLPALVAPFGASAVLLFGVPASPLAQPWSILGGNVVSALVGVLVALALGHGPLAIGAAVGLAILAMSFLRCLHPPGGAVAMTAVMGGQAVWDAGFAFPFGLVLLNGLVVVALGWLFHRVSGHAWPHKVRAAPAPDHFQRSDIRRALADAGEAFDVAEADLEMLLERAEHHARERTAAAKPPRKKPRA